MTVDKVGVLAPSNSRATRINSFAANKGEFEEPAAAVDNADRREASGFSPTQPLSADKRSDLDVMQVVVDGDAGTHSSPAVRPTGASPIHSAHAMNTARPPLSSVSAPSSAQSMSSGSASPSGRLAGFGTTASAALRQFKDALTPMEMSEILEYPRVYFVGQGAGKIQASRHLANVNFGFDDERGDYRTVNRDHLAFRYEVLGLLGKGSFGQVLKCFDHKDRCLTAVKVIRNKKRFHHQALVEVKILEHLKHRDSDDSHNIVHMLEYFYFRRHLCISFELLSENLYELIRQNDFAGLSMHVIHRFASQVITALQFLQKQRIIHCDLKPENILLKQPNRSAIKIIDFGSSCFEDERVYTYIQSRFYRSPEVVLGLPYNVSIDMWSFACILAELYTGSPLFPGENESEQILCIMEVLGPPPQHLLQKASRRKMFFDANLQPCIKPNSRGKRRLPSTKDLATVLAGSDPAFVGFLRSCLLWDPGQRLTPEMAQQHQWIRGSVPLSPRWSLCAHANSMMQMSPSRAEPHTKQLLPSHPQPPKQGRIRAHARSQAQAAAAAAGTSETHRHPARHLPPVMAPFGMPAAAPPHLVLEPTHLRAMAQQPLHACPGVGVLCSPPAPSSRAHPATTKPWLTPGAPAQHPGAHPAAFLRSGGTSDSDQTRSTSSVLSAPLTPVLKLPSPRGVDSGMLPNMHGTPHRVPLLEQALNSAGSHYTHLTPGRAAPKRQLHLPPDAAGRHAAAAASPKGSDVLPMADAGALQMAMVAQKKLLQQALAAGNLGTIQQAGLPAALPAQRPVPRLRPGAGQSPIGSVLQAPPQQQQQQQALLAQAAAALAPAQAAAGSGLYPVNLRWPRHGHAGGRSGLPPTADADMALLPSIFSSGAPAP